MPLFHQATGREGATTQSLHTGKTIFTSNTKTHYGCWQRKKVGTLL